MADYSVFGGVLHADVAIPELRRTRNAAAPTWTLRAERDAAPPAPREVLGAEPVTPDAQVRLARTDDGWRIDFDDTGSFAVSSCGRAVRWWPGEAANVVDVHADLTGRVLPLALHAQGRYVLHASGVATRAEGIGFVAPKGSGKSTLALALVRRGARFLTDDALPISLDEGGVRLHPGVARARCWDDSARAVGADLGRATRGAGNKHVLAAFPRHALQQTPVRCGALYLLRAVVPDPGAPAARRHRLTGVESALVLVHHAKLGPLLGGDAAPALLRQATRLAERVPVYALDVARDLTRLDEAAREILRWHA